MTTKLYLKTLPIRKIQYNTQITQWCHLLAVPPRTAFTIIYSNRKILNDLSSDAPAVPRIEEEKAEEDSSVAAATPAITTVTVPTPIYQTSSGQYSR